MPGGLALPVAALAAGLAIVLPLAMGAGAAGLPWGALDRFGFDLVRAAQEAFPGLGPAMRPFTDHDLLKMGPPVLALVGV